jgi:bis(5'-nucleosidyl)-tetraphosphatase
MKQQYSAGIIIYTKKDSTILYLLLRYGSGHWDFPKGKIEAGETKQEAALRELKEETNLTAQIDDNFEKTIQYVFTDYISKEAITKTVYFFTGHALTTDVKLSHEHTDFTWLPYQEAVAKLAYNNAKEILIAANTHNSLTN